MSAGAVQTNVGPQGARHPYKRDTVSLTYNFNNFIIIITITNIKYIYIKYYINKIIL